MSQIVKNLGTGGSALDARLGSASGADSNDPKFLDWDGENYVYLPGVAGNYLSVPDEAALDSEDFDSAIRVRFDAAPSGDVWFGIGDSASAGQYRVLLGVGSNLKVKIAWHDGILGRSATSTVAAPIVIGQTIWLRATLDYNAGGTYAANFYSAGGSSSAEPSVWSAIGTQVTGAQSALSPLTGKDWQGSTVNSHASAAFALFRAIVKDGIDGTPVLDVDCSQITSGADTSFTALTGQTVTINRSTSGRKAVAVTHPCWLFGTDDYMEVADNALLDFGASDSFTVLAVVRRWASNDAGGIVTKANNVTSVMTGWALYDGGATAYSWRYGNSNRTIVNGGAMTTGALQLVAAVHDDSAPTTQVSPGGTATTDSSDNMVSTSFALQIGRLASSSDYVDGELVAAAVFRRALTADEIKLISDYYASRVP